MEWNESDRERGRRPLLPRWLAAVKAVAAAAAALAPVCLGGKASRAHVSSRAYCVFTARRGVSASTAGLGWKQQGAVVRRPHISVERSTNKPQVGWMERDRDINR